MNQRFYSFEKTTKDNVRLKFFTAIGTSSFEKEAWFQIKRMALSKRIETVMLDPRNEEGISIFEKDMWSVSYNELVKWIDKYDFENNDYERFTLDIIKKIKELP